MSASLQELLAQRAAIEKQIADAQREARQAAISQVKALMSEYGLSAADIAAKGTGVRAAAAPKTGGKVPAKYRNAATGETWTGRGLQPKWLKSALASGARIDDFTL